MRCLPCCGHPSTPTELPARFPRLTTIVHTVPRHAAPSKCRFRPWLIALAPIIALVIGGGTAVGVVLSQRDAKTDQNAQPTTAQSPTRSTDAADKSEDPAPSVPRPDPEPEPQPDATFTILAGGDILTHEPVNNSARTGQSYDYAPLLAGIDQWVQGADLALCHLEVPVAPEGTAPSGYPMFGAPREIVADIAKQGWDGCSTASNHSVDRGWDGIVATADAMDEHGLGFVGTSVSKKQQRQAQQYVLGREGQRITVAHVAATYGTNGLPVPSGREWSVDLIDTAQLLKQAERARDDGADLVLVSLHFGQEYRIEPTAQQLEVAQELADSGLVDMVIGHHAHISQPMTKLPGGPDGQGMWVAYGLGNMISNQDASCCVAGTESGLLMIATVVKPADQPARVVDLQWQGVTVDRRGGHRLFPFASNLKKGAGTLSSAEMQVRRERVQSAVGDEMDELREPPTPTGPTPQVVPRSGAQ